MSDNATIPPGEPASSASASSLRSKRKVGRRRSESESMRREAPVQRAPAQPKRPGGQRDVAVIAAERLLDEQALRILERQLVQAGRRRRRARTECEVSGAHHVALRE